MDGYIATGGRVLEISPDKPRQEISLISPDVFTPRDGAMTWQFPARSVSVAELECRAV